MEVLRWISRVEPIIHLRGHSVIIRGKKKKLQLKHRRFPKLAYRALQTNRRVPFLLQWWAWIRWRIAQPHDLIGFVWLYCEPPVLPIRDRGESASVPSDVAWTTLHFRRCS